MQLERLKCTARFAHTQLNTASFAHLSCTRIVLSEEGIFTFQVLQGARRQLCSKFVPELIQISVNLNTALLKKVHHFDAPFKEWIAFVAKKLMYNSSLCLAVPVKY